MYRTLSWRNIPTARTLFAMVFIAGIGLIISIVALLYLSLHLISTKTNEIDEHRSALSVQGAIQTSVNRVSSLVLDNAVWDDAVRETYRPTLDPTGCITPGALALKSTTFMTALSFLMNTSMSSGDRFKANRSKRRTSIFGKGFKALINQYGQALPGDKNIYAGSPERVTALPLWALG
jgi:hypothetical protein